MSLPAITIPQIIGLGILHSLWQITLLWLVLVVALRLWPKASSSVRYALSISILILSILATAATVVYGWQTQMTSEEISGVTGGSGQTIEIVYIKVKQTILTGIANALNASAPILAWLWCTGLVLMGARFGGSVFYLNTLRAQENTAAISPIWEHELKRLSQALGLRREVAIATSTRISSPLTLGHFSPIILVPAGLLSGLSTAQIEAILVHELYHVRRYDYIVNICQALVEVMLFYHPAIWHINNIIREERENCCDDETVAFCGDAMAYARALTQLQEINTLTKPTLAMSATGPNSGNFTNRIKRLFNIYPNPAKARSKGVFAICFLILYLGAVLATANVSTAQKGQPENESLNTSVTDYNMFSDSIPVSEHFYALDEKEINPEKEVSLLDGKIHALSVQAADTTLAEQSLAKCLRKVRLIISMGTHRLPDGRLNFSQFSATDSFPSFNIRPVTYRGGLNLPTAGNSDPIETTGSVSYPGESTSVEIEAADPLYIIDGVKLDRAQNHIALEKVAAGTITAITGYSGQQAIDHYGDEGKHGVIDIRLKPETSIDKFTQPKAVNVFPNSTTGQLNISFMPAHHDSQVKMTLSDLNGTVVKEITDSKYTNTPTELQVDVSGLEKGVYILQIVIDGAKSQKRIVIE